MGVVSAVMGISNIIFGFGPDFVTIVHKNSIILIIAFLPGYLSAKAVVVPHVATFILYPVVSIIIGALMGCGVAKLFTSNLKEDN